MTQSCDNKPDANPLKNGCETHSRRHFIKQASAIGGAILAGSLASQPAALAATAEDLRGRYFGYSNLYEVELTIDQQNNHQVLGRFQDGTAMSGIVTGARPNGGDNPPLTLTCVRTLADGTRQTYIGAASIHRGNEITEATTILLAGVFYHNGLGPYPWSLLARRTQNL